MEKEFTKSYAIKRIAELTEQIEEWRSLYSALMKDCQMQIEEYNKIKNQLAEKEEKIAILKQELSDKESKWAKYSKNLCIEQIKNLKSLILNSWLENGCNLILGDVGELIDNQIAELENGSDQNDK